MKKRLVIIAITLLLACCSHMGNNLEDTPGWERASWDFIQSVGGIAIGEPYIESDQYQYTVSGTGDGYSFQSTGDGLVIPIIHDFSGKFITIEPTVHDNDLLCAAAVPSVGTSAGEFFLSTVIEIQFFVFIALEDDLQPQMAMALECSRLVVPLQHIHDARNDKFPVESRIRVVYTEQVSRFVSRKHVIGEFSL